MVEIYEDKIGVEEPSIDEPREKGSPSVFSTVMMYLVLGIAMQVGTWFSERRLPTGERIDLHPSEAVGIGGTVLAVVSAILLALIVVSATRKSAPFARSIVRAGVLLAVCGSLLWWHQGVAAASYSKDTLVFARSLQQDTVIVDGTSLKDYRRASIGPVRYLVLDIDHIGEVRTRPVFYFDYRATSDLDRIDTQLQILRGDLR